MNWFKRLLKLSYWSFIIFLAIGFVMIGLVIFYLEEDLPDIRMLNQVQLQVPLRIYTYDGELIAEYGEKKRIPVPYEQIPRPLIQAVLATEDQRFFEHSGVDLLGLARAAIQVIITGNKVQGGSTITMQVARNFFLTRKKTYSRKLKEILLAIKIDNELSKEKIINLYLNKIYLGNRAYGVGAAAQVYYGKNLSELTLEQMAMIAGLPKAPSTLNPLRNPEAALKRRNHVLNRMLEQGYISENDYDVAVNTPLTAKYHAAPITVDAPYVAEMVRNLLLTQMGDKAYTSGLNVYTTIHSQAVKAANQAVRKTLLAYDERHGYRGPIANLGTLNVQALDKGLAQLKQYPRINGLQPAIAIQTKADHVQAMLANGQIAMIPWEGIKWARPALSEGKYLGKVPQSVTEVVTIGDIIYLDQMTNNQYRLAQKPDVEIALVAINPQSGAIEALVGGFDFNSSNFNRATQAKRQPGSSFKPFIYSAALDKGFTLASIINDAPIVIANRATVGHWRPQNVNKRFFGPTRLRVGLIHSRKLVSIRLLEAIGIKHTINFLSNFGFEPQALPHNLSLALGTGAVTPLEMARAYAILANGGFKINPYIIHHISNDKNEIIYQAQPKIACEPCLTQNPLDFPEAKQIDPEVYAQQVIKPQVAYLMNSVLKDVITEGTGKGVSASGLQRADLAGKTGTTNEQKDAWFAGFNSDMAAVIWLGFDQPRSLHEYAARAAVPGWTEFMKLILGNKPEHHMPQPPGIIAVRIDPNTGKLASPGTTGSILEYFTEDTVPTESAGEAETNDSSRTLHIPAPFTVPGRRMSTSQAHGPEEERLF